MFQLKTFGGLYLEGDSGGEGGRSAGRRRLALLAALAAARGAPISRDRLIGWFWPEHDGGSARHALAQAVYEVRRALGDTALLGSAADDLRLDPHVVGSDVHEFHLALHQGDLERAVSLYGGPFLDGFYVGGSPAFEEWVESERERLARACAGALEDLARGAAARGDARRAFDWWSRLADLRPLDTRATLEAMRAGATAGERGGALHRAARHAAACRDQLDSEPDPSVEALANELRAVVPVPGAAASRGAEPPEGAVPVVRRRRIRPPAIVIASLAVVAAGLVTGRQLRPASLPEREVVLGTVQSSDPALGLAVREALRAELDGAPELRVAPEPALRESLRLMGVPADSGVGDAVAVELAQRRGATVAVVGSAESLGAGVSVVVEVFDGASGRSLGTIVAQPADQGAVIREVARLARAVRARATGTRAEPGEPLPRVTTSSLPALKAYVLARRAVGRGDRLNAVVLARAALVHDSTFALAHYLLGDQLWFLDQERASGHHLRRAFELSADLPPRERLTVEARYRQLVLDDPDSAAATWERVRMAFPDEVNAHEGLAWTYRALGRFAEAAEASATALALDPQALVPNVSSRLYALLALGDTLGAEAFARAQAANAPWIVTEVAWFAALLRGDTTAALTLLRRAYPLTASGAFPPDGAQRWQVTLLTAGRLAEAEQAMSVVVAAGRGQEPPRALLAQARAELGLGGSAEHAAALAREALAWLNGRDLSAPAYGRLLERVAEVAARAGDPRTLASVDRLLTNLDAGRDLRSYRLARESVAASRAFASGALPEAVRLVARSRTEPYFWRSIALLVLLEADALAAAGDTAAARDRYASLLRWPIAGDADYETWLVARAIGARAL